MTERQPRSRRPSNDAPGIDERVDAHSRPDFDPYKFSKVTVPPELRRQMVQAQLPRLEAEFFHDTLPPNQRALESSEPPPESPRRESLGDLPPRRRPIKLVLACLLGAALLLMLGLFKSGFWAKANRPPSGELLTPPLPSLRGAVFSAPPTRTLSPALTAPATRTAEGPASTAPMNSAPGSVSLGHLAPPTKITSQHNAALGSPLPKSANRDPRAAPDVPVATSMPGLAAAAPVPAEPSPSTPVAPKPVQTSWFSPK